LTPEETRVKKLSSLIYLAFSTASEVNRAIKNRLFITGLSLRVEPLRAYP
ncbi:uncharacterized protein K452DRAFT_234287, partial [Aplosporella prunicola CBS 121167]